MKNFFNKHLSQKDDYREIWTKFCFLDESGSLHSPDTPFFTIGIIKCPEPYYLNTEIRRNRDKFNFYDEIKFNKLSKAKLDFVKHIFKIFAETQSVNFYSYTINKNGQYYKKSFHSDPWKAYEEITIRLLHKAVIAPNEIITLLADNVTTPDKYKFEVDVEKNINDKCKRLAVAGVCRLDSKANDILQLTDLVIGAINYSLKLETGITKVGDRHKKAFAKFVSNYLNSEKPGFINGHKDKKFNIFVDKDVKKGIKKEPSS